MGASWLNSTAHEWGSCKCHSTAAVCKMCWPAHSTNALSHRGPLSPPAQEKSPTARNPCGHCGVGACGRKEGSQESPVGADAGAPAVRLPQCAWLVSAESTRPGKAAHQVADPPAPARQPHHGTAVPAVGCCCSAGRRWTAGSRIAPSTGPGSSTHWRCPRSCGAMDGIH